MANNPIEVREMAQPVLKGFRKASGERLI